MLRCIVLQLFVTTNESFVTSAFAHRAHTHGDTRFVKTQDLLCQVERRHKTLPVLAECRASRGDVDLSDSRASVSDAASSAGNSYWVRVGSGVGERFDHFLANRRRDGPSPGGGTWTRGDTRAPTNQRWKRSRKRSSSRRRSPGTGTSRTHGREHGGGCARKLFR